MKFIILPFLLLISQIDSFGQGDSVWNVMVLYKENLPEIKDNMAEYSPTGFYLYRNCFYDLRFQNKTEKTLRLVDIKLDTLIFIGISQKSDVDLTLTSEDTTRVHFSEIAKILLIRDFGSGASKKIDCDNYYFVFYKSLHPNYYESKFGFAFPGNDSNDELVPRLCLHGITYHIEYKGRLLLYSGIEAKAPYHTSEERIEALELIMTGLNLIVNKQLIIRIRR